MFVVLVLVLVAQVGARVRFKGILEDFPMNTQPRHTPPFKISNSLPKTSFLDCQEYPNEGIESILSTDKRPVRMCHMKGVCWNLYSGSIEISPALRAGSQIPKEQLTLSLNGLRGNFVTALNINQLPWHREKNVTVAHVETPTLFLRRYMAINTMHLFHDDFLPALATILQNKILFEADDRLIVAMDAFYEENHEKFLHWLGNFFGIDGLQASIRYQAGFKPDQMLDYICFEDAVVGIDPVSTSWYQYGYFERPQGPIKVSPETEAIVAENIATAVQWIKQNLDLEAFSNDANFISIVSRTKTRLILNELELEKDIQTAYPDNPVQFIRAEGADLVDLIAAFSESKVVIGIHGALLALTAFSPPGAKLIEIFPFAIPAQNYTPFKRLAGLLNITYHAWVNPREESPYNIGHPEASQYNGGLGHLPPSYAAGVMATKTVPEHVCCYSPFWIYRIFQDTHVNTTAISELIK